MAIRNIVKDSDEFLRKKCKKVDTFDKKLWALLDDMRETMNKANGVGLAAIQIGILKRIVVIEIEQDNVIEMINPKIIEQKDSQTGVEGCLSSPGVFGCVTRPNVVTIEAQDRKGKLFQMTGTELLARAFCHELDHLEGVLFSDHSDILGDHDDVDKFIKRQGKM